jgi:hypothetical protein
MPPAISARRLTSWAQSAGASRSSPAVSAVHQALERFDRRRDILARPDFRLDHIESERVRCCLRRVSFEVDLWIRGIEQDRQPAQTLDNFTQELEPLADGLGLHKRARLRHCLVACRMAASDLTNNVSKPIRDGNPVNP